MREGAFLVRVSGCIFLDTPKECWAAVSDKCIADTIKLHCLFHHIHLIVADDAKQELLSLFTNELNNLRRYKMLSGQAGRERG